MEYKSKSSGSYSHILKYTSLFGGVQWLNILIALVRNKLVALILGPGGMGLVSLFNSTINFVSNSTNFGLSMSAVRNISEAFSTGNEAAIRRSVKLIRSWSLLTALLGMVVCAALSPLLNDVTFSWGDHTLHFVLLSPIVGMMAITGGEMAVLKGLRRLSALAIISVYGVIGALVTTVPIYYFMGERGIVPSLLVMALTQMALTIAYSYRSFPPRVSLQRSFLRKGNGMIRLGTAFLLAGILGSGAELAIRSYLNNVAQLDTVGLYNAAYMVTMTYAGMVLSSMETDYYPRLSAVNADPAACRTTVNRQIEVSLLLMSPLLVAFTISMPVLLPLLYSSKFLPALGMMHVMVIAMYFRAIKLPVAYLTLAKGDSLSYLLLEGIYDVIVVLLVMLFYNLLGIIGAGVAVTVAGIIDFFTIILYTRYKYGYRLSGHVIRYALMQIPIGMAAYGVTFIAGGWAYWLLGILLTMASTAVSVRILQRKTSLRDKLVNKIIGKFRRHG